MKTVEEFGRTVDEAREKAFKALGIKAADEEGVEVEVLDEGSPGNDLGWGRKFARIKVTLRRAAASPAKAGPLNATTVKAIPAKIREEEAADIEGQEEEGEDDDLDETAREVLEEILDRMRLHVNVEEDENLEGQPILNIVGPDQGLLIGKHGQTLDALQFIVSLIVNKEAHERKRITLDAGGYRLRREKTLKDLAWRMARRALDERCQIALEPMNPAERRIIHMALADDPDIETFSEGEEPSRKVIISPRR